MCTPWMSHLGEMECVQVFLCVCNSTHSNPRKMTHLHSRNSKHTHTCGPCCICLLPHHPAGASLKFTVLNPKGRVWLMVAGGGASVIYAGVC